MQHYANGSEIQCKDRGGTDYRDFEKHASPSWNWQDYDYRIKEQKETITIEKWVLKNKGELSIIEGTNRRLSTLINLGWIKVKLLDSYEVQM